MKTSQTEAAAEGGASGAPASDPSNPGSTGRGRAAWSEAEEDGGERAPADSAGFAPDSEEADASPADADSYPSGGDSVGVTIPEYLRDRVQDQIDWYERKSASAQSWFKGLRSVEILSAAAIPLLSGYAANWPPAGFIAGVLGALVAALAGLLALYQHQERWRNYRGTAEALKREKFLFLTRSAPYDGPGAFPRLVQAVEARLADESAHWASYIAPSAAPAQGSAARPPGIDEPPAPT